MLIFYRTEDCPGCKGIQSTIEAMRLAHKVVIVKLEEFKEQWYKFQSDACYCDEEGNII